MCNYILFLFFAFEHLYPPVAAFYLIVATLTEIYFKHITFLVYVLLHLLVLFFGITVLRLGVEI